MGFYEDINIRGADSPSTDAFGRWRVSEPSTIFDSKMVFDNLPLIWDDQQTSGTGASSTYNANQASVTMTVSASTAGTRVRQSKQFHVYQPGKSQLGLFTGVFGAKANGITRRVGQFDSNNGLFFQLSGTSTTALSVCIRSKTSGTATDNAVGQPSWNLDKMDGTGPSGITLDTTKAQIMMIDYEWLGVGRVRFGWNVNGITYYCHQFLHANSVTAVYMSNANLPVRYEISNDGTGTSASLVHICSTIISEGGLKDVGTQMCIGRETVLSTNNSASAFPLIAIRQKSDHLNSSIVLHHFNVTCTSSSNFMVKIVVNPVITGTALGWTDLTNSCMQYCATSTSGSVVSGGTEIFCSMGAAGQGEAMLTDLSPTQVAIGSKIDGTADILVVSVMRLTGTSEDFYGALHWKEIY